MIESVEKETFDRVWKLVHEIGTQERHFNTLQATYRGMASAWLLASFSAIGFVMSTSMILDPAQKLLLVSGIALAGCIGIGLLWVIDLLVYHRLLDSYFIEGLILEDQYPWLPPIRHNMMRTQMGEGVLFRVVGFYLGPVFLPILIAGVALSFWLWDIGHLLSAGATVGMSLVLAVLSRYHHSEQNGKHGRDREAVGGSEIWFIDVRFMQFLAKYCGGHARHAHRRA